MKNILLCIGLTLFTFSILEIIHRLKDINKKIIFNLFMYGILLSIPFVIVEHLHLSIKSYLIILSFIGIELITITIEHKSEFIHKLIHHNIKELRILSFFIVSLGFTYSELSFYIINSHESLLSIVSTLPLKTLFALFTHTVLTSSAAILSTTESVIEHFFLFLIYYLRLVFISISHYLYTFFNQNGFHFLFALFIGYNIFLLYKHKRYLDKKGDILS